VETNPRVSFGYATGSLPMLLQAMAGGSVAE